MTLGILLNARAAESLNFTTTKVQTLNQSLSQKPNHSPTTLKEKFTGDFLLLDFWASWCGPCKESLPFYQELQKRYSAQGLQVLALSVDTDVKEANTFILKNNFSLIFLWDENQTVANSLGIKAIPTTLILDKAGKILYQERGFLTSSKNKLEQFLQKILKKAK